VNPWLAELKRTLLLRPVLGLIVGLMALAVVLAALPLSPNEYPPPATWSFSATYSYTTEFQFEFYVFDGTGHPLEGAVASVTLRSTNSSAGFEASGTSTTGANGLALVAVQAPDTTFPADYSVNVPGLGLDTAGSGVREIQPGQLSAGPGVFTWIRTGSYNLQPTLQLFFISPAGTIPQGTQLRTNLTNGSEPPVTLATVPIPTAQPMDVTPPSGNLPPSAVVTFEVLAPAGTILAFIQNPPAQFAPIDYEHTNWGQVLDSTLTEWTFFAAVGGVLLGYAVYGRDRTRRTLEPILALPTTDSGLLLRRLVVGLVAVFLGVGIGSGIDLLGDQRYAPQFFPQGLVIAWCLGVVGVAFVFLSLTLLLSRLSQSSWVMIGSGIVLSTILVAVWALAGEIFSSGNVLNSTNFAGLGSKSSPLTWLPLAIARDYFSHLGSPAGLSAAADYALALGLTLCVLLAVGFVAGAMILAQRRD
jgi:ABC-type transport system involved in multi-copper enzyme maturation permease subunit